MAQNLLERERAKWAATQADVLSSLSTEQLASAVAEVDLKHVKAVAELDARQIRAMAELEAKQGAAAQLVQTQIAELRNENQAFRTRLERAVSEVDAKQSAAASLIQSLLAQIAELRTDNQALRSRIHAEVEQPRDRAASGEIPSMAGGGLGAVLRPATLAELSKMSASLPCKTVKAWVTGYGAPSGKLIARTTLTPTFSPSIASKISVFLLWVA